MNDPKVKILHITFNMGIGGTEQVIRQIIENSDYNKFQHEILCIDGMIGAVGKGLQAKGINIESVQRNPGTDLKLVRFIHRYVKHHKVDVLHCHQYTPYFYGVLGALLTRAKVIFTEHGRFYPDRHHFKRRFINPLLVLATAHITVISKSTAEAVAKYEYINPKKIKVIYNGIRKVEAENKTRDDLLSELELPDNFRYIGTISRLEPIKNQSMMINAFSQLRKAMPECKLIIIGDGAKMSDLKNQAKSLGLEQAIIFTGFLDNPQRFIQLFDVFLLSSFSEGTSMTLLEAMSLSKPCVVTDVGGNPEVVSDGVTGIVVKSDDTDNFASAILGLLQNETRRTALGTEALRCFKKKFSVEKMISGYQSLYLGE